MFTSDSFKGKGAAPGHLQVKGDPAQLVYIGNLAYSVNWQDLKAHMAQAGTVEFCKVLTEDGWDSGKSRGTGCVRYSSAEEANYAIATLAESELAGRRILVDHWDKSSTVSKGSPSMGMKGNQGKGKVFNNPLMLAMKQGWSDTSGKGNDKGKGKMRFSPYKGGGNSQLQVKGDASQMVYVGSLSYSVKWPELKDHMSQAGTVEFCKVLTEDGWDNGKSRGTGCVRYSTAEEANNAIALLAESELAGRRILVDHWGSAKPL
mmetsp:Transcript_256/g.348  ORF Transcript_256/g.348 Transcript_256/m.348 type:complete len:261 (-) Transcript_256:125-907(-)